MQVKKNLGKLVQNEVVSARVDHLVPVPLLIFSSVIPSPWTDIIDIVTRHPGSIYGYKLISHRSLEKALC